MAEKRKRSQNFGADEKDRLVKLIALHKQTILNKRTDGSTNEAKNKAWVDVTNSFNASARVYRPKDSLIKVWEKLKSESKLYYGTNRRSVCGTGGGPSEFKIDPILEQVCRLLGRACTGIEGVEDCDAEAFMEVENTEPTIIYIAGEDTAAPSENATSEDCEAHSAIHQNITINQEVTNKEKLQENDNISNVPLWSRRRPQISQRNERTEAVSTLCTSFKNINKKKEDIEDLKRELLQEEIVFKRRLYELQLQAAEKEVEIKTEILNQLKGGTVNVHQLFGGPHK